MIRLTHLTGSLQGTSSTSPKAIIRIGRGADCDVRFDARLDTRVSTHHAEIRFDNGHYLVVDVGSSNGTLVNGKLVRTQKLRSGDKIVFGAQGGPEVKFEVDNSAHAAMGGGMRGAGMGNGAARGYGQPLQQPPMAYGQAPAARKAEAQPSGDAQSLAREAQQKISQARAMSGGQPSGQTMFIMADTLQKVEQVTHKKDRKKTVRIVLTIVSLALAGFGGLGVVIWQQKQQLEKILHKKDNLDKQIQKIQIAMQTQDDPEKLAQLEEQLTLLTGKAQQTIGELEQKDKSAAEKVENQGDDLDREIRRILSKFSAQTYLVPPLFKERLKYHIEQTVNRSNTRTVYARKLKYWPMIIKEFSALGLPEEMAFVAWTESYFDPLAESPVGARGMWQFMAPTARNYGLRVDSRVDERIDAAKETKAAARYLANLLVEFGEDSFMLAFASYNKGEAGMRKVLHQLTQEPGGFRKEKRDFWHLYRLKKLPQETLEYVPQILAAAVICNNPKKYGLE
jgi:soluble lytic murein transglycosylase-like protein